MHPKATINGIWRPGKGHLTLLWLHAAVETSATPTTSIQPEVRLTAVFVSTSPSNIISQWPTVQKTAIRPIPCHFRATRRLPCKVCSPRSTFHLSAMYERSSRPWPKLKSCARQVPSRNFQVLHRPLRTMYTSNNDNHRVRSPTDRIMRLLYATDEGLQDRVLQ